MTATPELVSIVDDDDSVRESLPDLVRQLGFAAEAFSSAEAFLGSDLLNETRCLILDVTMPGMSGLDVLRLLKTRGNAIPVILISAHDDENTRARGRELGADCFMRKPLDGQALLDAIARLAQDQHGPQALVSVPTGSGR